MRLFFTQDELNNMLHLQKNLDIKVRDNNDIDQDEDLILEKFLAIKTEIFELANEIESFKYWKKNKGKTNQLEEACDVLSFALSIANEKDVELVECGQDDNYDPDKYDINELIGIMDCMISDMYMERDWVELNSFLLLLGIVVNKCGYDIEELYKGYKAKNKVNNERQDNNY